MTNLATTTQDQAVSHSDFSIRFTAEQRKIILDTCCGGASEKDAAALIAIAESRGLNPIQGECYFVKRYDSQTRTEKWAVQASIDAFRIKSEDTGLYDGQDEPEFEYKENGELLLARVRVYRKGWSRPAVGVARYDEYVQRTREGAPTKFWKTMPHNQLAKCAEVAARRIAFPKRFAQVYVSEEMDQAENVDALPPVQQAKQLAPPSVGEDESAKLLKSIGEKMAKASSHDELQIAREEATASKPRMKKADIDALVKVFVESQKRLDGVVVEGEVVA